MSFFTHYWTGETVKREAQGPVADLDHTAGNQFTSRGVMPGDTIYIISFSHGVLYVVGTLVVDSIVSKAQARAILGTSNLWSANEHVIAKRGESSRAQFDSPLSQSDLQQVEFIRSDGSVMPPKRNRHGHIDPQTFRGVREITATTASVFDGYVV